MSDEELLRASREGNEEKVKVLLVTGKQVDVNCAGRSNWNREWTALHLATYFGHLGVVRMLLEHGAQVDILNGMGDTPLHKAALTGREDIARLLLEHGADARLINSEGFEPHHLSKATSVRRLLEAAAKLQEKRSEIELLHAARDGDVERINTLIKSPYPPQINCTDSAGNAPLHNAAFRGHVAAVILFLQHGVDISIENNAGHTALDLARSLEVKKVLGVKPAREIRQQATKFEGRLLKSRVFFGFKPVWLVLERGALMLYTIRKSGERQLNSLKHLAQSQICSKSEDEYSFLVRFQDRNVLLLKVPPDSANQVERQKWINSLKEHREYANANAHSTASSNDTEAVGTIDSTLKVQAAEAQHQVLQRKVDEAKDLVEQLATNNSPEQATNLVTAVKSTEKFSEILQIASELSVSLGHCVGLVAVQEELNKMRTESEAEEKRVLEESVHALAFQNQALKDSVAMLEGIEVERFDENSSDSDEFFDTHSEHSRPQSRTRSLSERFEDPLDSQLTSSSSSLSQFRSLLPVTKPTASYSLWMIVKHCIGRDMSRITLPVFVNEPLSFLQRTAEALEYCYLINKAIANDSPLERTKFITAFVVSTITCCHERIWKPFNPLLGETYELTREDLGFRILLEQVSHHPPVTAFDCEGQGYTLKGSLQATIQITAHGLDVTPQGLMTLHLLKRNEVYIWRNPDVRVHNLIIGKMWVERIGLVEVKNLTSGHRGVVDFKESGWFHKRVHHVEGYIESPEKETKYRLEGKWIDELLCYRVPNSNPDIEADGRDLEAGEDQGRVLWRVEPRPEEASQMYNMSRFAMSLNELRDDIDTLAPTDSRLRPDIRLMENGDMKGAGDEKHRLEEKQRAARRKRHEAKEEWVPCWFKKETNPHTREIGWVFTGSYWQRDFSQCPDIY